jgi:PA domain-containing protein/flagellar hook capping protein FlgD
VRSTLRSALHAAFLLTLLTGVSHATTITIVNQDGPNEGFNDPTPAAPVGGNPGTTVGAQRLFVFQRAADIWEAILPSNIEIRVQAQFNALSCTATSGVLGSAGAVNVVRDFPTAPLAAHWYHVALGNKLANTDLVPGSNDISAQFNSSVGQTGCLETTSWYYGVDGNAGSKIDLLSTVLHELGHGLGFSTTTSGSTGAILSGFPHVWDHFLLDNTNGLVWDQMSSAQRVASANACTHLVWAGSYVEQQAPAFLGAKPVLRVNSPPAIAADYEVGTATFGPTVTSPGVTQAVVLVNDGVGTTSDGCEALINGAAVNGKIALVDRGTCGFAQKVKNAQNAGAIGVIIADNVAGCPPSGLGGVDPTITIPAVRITLADGNTLKANLPGVNATLTRDPTRLAGADASGRVKMYSPSTFASGSSVSHFDVTADPDLLMEPFATPLAAGETDLTRWLLADTGWFRGLVAVGDPVAARTRLIGNAPNPFGSLTTIRFALERDGDADLAIFDLDGRKVASLHRGSLPAGAHSLDWRGVDDAGRHAPPGIYLVRLQAEGTVESARMVKWQ